MTTAFAWKMDKVFKISRIFCLSLVLVRLSSAFYCKPIESPGIACLDKCGNEIDCSIEQPIGAQVKCRPFYISATQQTTSCGPNGWNDEDFSCRIVCGKSKEANSSLERPYGATLYQMIKKDLNSKICAATLIGDGYVITIAHCLLDHMDRLLETDILIVGLGPAEDETLYKVKSVTFANSFNDTAKVIDPDDLVILTLENFTLTHEIIPVCLPKCGQLDEVALEDGATGEMYSRGQHHAQKLKVKVTANCTHFNDFCAGTPFSDRRTKKCPEEIGTGITISIGEDAHFIYGVLSSNSNPTCIHWRTFKRIFPFIEWIRTVANVDYVPPRLQYFTAKEELSGDVSPPYTMEPDLNDTRLVYLASITCSPLPEDNVVHSTLPTVPELTVVEEVINPTTVNFTSTTPKIPTSEENFVDTVDGNLYFEEIPADLQTDMTNLTITNKKIMNSKLLNSLKYAKKLKRLEIHDASIDAGFDGVEELPKLVEYVLKDVAFGENPKHFRAYFPFFKTKNWNSSDLPIDYDEITIDDGVRRFYMKPDLGRLVVSNFPDLNVDKILNGLESTKTGSKVNWRQLSLHDTQFNFSVIPGSLVHLSLSEVAGGPELGKLLMTKLRDLETLAIHDLQDKEVKLEELPKESLKSLRLDRANLTFATSAVAESSSGWASIFSSQSTPKFPIFENLEIFYWGVDVTMDEPVVSNFPKIFPNLKQVGYFGWNNITILKQFLKLKKLELMYVRIHKIHEDEGQEIMKLVKFDFSTVKNFENINIIQLCMERKSGDKEFVTRYVVEPKDTKEIGVKFPDGFDIPQCAGFDG